MALRDQIPVIAGQEGVPAWMLARLVNTESAGNASAVSSKGARGPAQLMPATAAELGVNINDPTDNVRGGARYLKQQLDTFGDPRLALAAYNAGPGAVKKAGGIPNYPETQAYVGKVMAGNPSSDDIFGFGQGAPKATPAAGSDDIFAMKPSAAQAPASAAVPSLTPATAPHSVGSEVAGDALAGLLTPFQKLGADVKASYDKTVARAKAPLPSIPQALADTAGDIGDTARNIGDVLGLAGAPIQAVVNPIAGALSRHGPQAYDGPKVAMVGGKPVILPARALSQPEAQAALSGDINTALSAAAPSSRMSIAAAPAQTAMKPAQLEEAKRAAYKAVDATGVKYTPQAVTDTVNAIKTDLANLAFNPDLHPRTAAALKTLESKAGQTQSITDLDQLRQVVQRDVVSGGSAGERLMGNTMKAGIDSLINNAGPGDIIAGNPIAASEALAKARDLNTRFMKAQEVQDRLDSADLRASSTYAGGNQVNAIRQNLRPLIDPKSAQRIGNLTPDEQAALNTVVRGSAAQNGVRLTGKLLDPRGLLGAAAQTMLGVSTHGIGPLVTTPVGIAATEAGKAMTAKQVENLLALIAAGGQKSALPRSAMFAGPASGRAYVGVPTTLAPLARIPSPKGRASTH